MFHVVVLDLFYMFSLDPMVLYFDLVDFFQVSGPAQRRTWTPIENHWRTVEKQSGTTRGTTEPRIWERECPGGVAAVAAGGSSR